MESPNNLEGTIILWDVFGYESAHSTWAVPGLVMRERMLSTIGTKSNDV